MKSCLVCFSVPFESQPFRRKISGSKLEKNLRVMHGGIGKNSFVPALNHAIASHKPGSVVFAGFCAGIHPCATIGTTFASAPQDTSVFRANPDNASKACASGIILETEVGRLREAQELEVQADCRTPNCTSSVLRADDTSRINPASCAYRPEPTDVSRIIPRTVTGCLSSGFPKGMDSNIRGSLISVDKVLATSAEKARLAENHPGVLVADMETVSALEITLANEIPSFVLRVVSDGPDVDLPLPPEILFNQKTQQTSLLRLCGHLLTRSSKRCEFFKFVLDVHLARKVLADELIAMFDFTKMP